MRITLITSHDLFPDEQPSMLLAIWMLSKPRIEEMWYDALSKSSTNDTLLENLNLAQDGYSDMECLAMKKYSKSNPKFSLAVDVCNRKRTAICRVDPQMISSVTQTPKFPCLTKSSADRRKRNAAQGQELEKHKGVFSYLCLVE